MIVRYGSGDSAIVLECSLTSAAAITAAGGTLLGSGHQFDHELGMIGGTAGSVYMGEVPDYAQVGMWGQWSIDVESDWLAYSLVTDSGAGAAPGANEELLSHGATNSTVTTPYGRFRVNATGEFMAVPDDTTAQTATRCTRLSNANRFSTLTFGHRGNFVDMYIDGRFVQTRSRQYTTSLFRHLWLNCLRGLTSGGLASHYIRNLVVSSKSIHLARWPRIGWLGDSFVTQAEIPATDAVLAAPGYDGRAGMSCTAALMRRGLNPYQVFSGVSGGQTSHAAGTTILSGRAAILAACVDIVHYKGGTNDANTGAVPADFESSIKVDITTCLAAYVGPRHFVITNCPSTYPVAGSHANDAVVDEINAIYAGLPAWWDAANPADTGRVHVIDVFAATGGHEPISKYFVATDNGLLNESHFTAAGQRLWGEMFADVLIGLLPDM